MKRRHFLRAAASAAVLTGAATGFSAQKVKTKQIKPKVHDFSGEFLKITKPKPKGAIEMRELGKTGIKVSYYSFGSHTPKELMKVPEYRKKMLMEGYDLGINTFDVYAPQYETTGEYLSQLGNNNYNLSVHTGRSDGRTATQEWERILKFFKRDHIDMVRIFAHEHKDASWGDWDEAFKMKEQGKIRAIGVPVHFPEELDTILKDKLPLDFVIFPYNFYHNILYTGKVPKSFDPMVKEMRKRGMGVVTMKPFASEWYVAHLMDVAKELDPKGELSLGQAMLRFIINSGLEPDVTFGGMWCIDDLYDNVAAYYNPKISKEEIKFLDNVRDYAKLIEDAALPDHYKFLKRWAPGNIENMSIKQV